MSAGIPNALRWTTTDESISESMPLPRLLRPCQEHIVKKWKPFEQSELFTNLEHAAAIEGQGERLFVGKPGQEDVIQ